MPVMGDTHSIVCIGAMEVEGGGLPCHMFFLKKWQCCNSLSL